MAEGYATATANSILNALCNGTTYTASATDLWIQLHTAAPGAAGTTAIATNSTRKQVSFGVAASGLISNDAAISWTAGQVTGTEDYTHYSLWTAVTSGTFICSGVITANAVVAGDTFTFPIGDIDLTIPVAS